MTSLTNFDINKHNENTKKSIKNSDKPLSAYQYYTKTMREKWHNLTEDEKDDYLLKAKIDKQRYEDEKKALINQSKEEIKKLNIFLVRSHSRVPCVGLDNGFTSYEVRGPVDTIELFTEEEKKKLEEKGVDAHYIGKYKSINGMKFNWRASKAWSVKVYGGNKNNSDSWWAVRENYKGKVCNYTKYNNYKGETWTVDR